MTSSVSPGKKWCGSRVRMWKAWVEIADGPPYVPPLLPELLTLSQWYVRRIIGWKLLRAGSSYSVSLVFGPFSSSLECICEGQCLSCHTGPWGWGQAMEMEMAEWWGRSLGPPWAEPPCQRCAVYLCSFTWEVSKLLPHFSHCSLGILLLGTICNPNWWQTVSSEHCSSASRSDGASMGVIRSRGSNVSKLFPAPPPHMSLAFKEY